MKKEFRILGLESTSDAKKAEASLRKLPGASAASVKLDGSASAEFTTTPPSFEKIRDAVIDAGFDAEEKAMAKDAEKEAREKEIRDYWRRFVISLLLSLPLLFLFLEHLKLITVELPELVMTYSALIQFLIATPVMWVNRIIFIRGYRAIVYARSPTMDSLVGIGVGASYIYSVLTTFGFPGALYYEVGSFLLTFIVLGKYLEAVARGRTSEAIKALIGLQPKTATVIRNKREVELPIEQVQVGDIIIVKPGEKIPVDGIVLGGESAVDESMVTGESMPVMKKKGATLIGATINKNGVLTFRATKVGSDTMLAQIIKLVQDAQASKAPIQEIVDKVSAYFVPVVAAVSILAFSYWFFAAGQPFSFALSIFMSVLIIACPCALGLATPTAITAGMGLGAQRGILFKSSKSLQAVQSLNAIVFDKTGTLTKGEPVITDVIPMKGFSERELLIMAASVEKNSEHPIADAIVKGATARKLSLLKVASFKAIEGKGVSAKISGATILVGTSRLLSDHKINGLSAAEKAKVKLENEGKTAVLLSAGGKVAGVIAVADTLKDSTPEAVSALRKKGLRVIMITGDNWRTAKAIGKQAGIVEVLAEVLPQDKEKEVKKLQAKGLKVAMVGDGINDAPALAAADVGIAIGSGTDVAIETGDIVLVKNDLRDVVTAIDLSNFTMRKIKENLFWAFAYNMVGIPVAAGILFPFLGILLDPAIAGAAMALSSVSVTTNASLMRFYKSPMRES